MKSLTAILLIGLIAILWIGVMAESDGPTPRRRQREYSAQARATIVSAVETSLADGGLYSLDIAAHTARVDPLVWSGLPLETKQAMVECLSAYFDIQRGYRRVTILSNRNDTKLATYTPFSGMKILQ